MLSGRLLQFKLLITNGCTVGVCQRVTVCHGVSAGSPEVKISFRFIVNALYNPVEGTNSLASPKYPQNRCSTNCLECFVNGAFICYSRMFRWLLNKTFVIRSAQLPQISSVSLLPLVTTAPSHRITF